MPDDDQPAALALAETKHYEWCLILLAAGFSWLKIDRLELDDPRLTYSQREARYRLALADRCHNMTSRNRIKTRVWKMTHAQGG